MTEGSNHNEQVMYMLGEMRSDIKSTLEQVKKTNGRVTDLEAQVGINTRFIEGLKAKVAVVSGAISLAGFLALEWIKTKFFT